MVFDFATKSDKKGPLLFICRTGTIFPLCLIDFQRFCFEILGIRSIRRTVVKFVQASQYNSVHLTYVTVLSSPVADIWKQVKKENMQKVELLQN